MTSTAIRAGRPRRRLRAVGDWRDLWRASLPVLALLGMLLTVFSVQPSTESYSGLTLLLQSSVPLLLASIAQMWVITLGDIDLGIGSAIGLVNVIAATWLGDNPLLGIVTYVGVVAGYMAMGALIHVRRLPAIVVTLGASFTWLGLAILKLPTPGGLVPGWLVNSFNINPPLVPLPILIAVLAGLVGHVLLMRTRYGTIVRGIGGNAEAMGKVGWSLIAARVLLYGLAGIFVVLAGLAVTANTTSGDANASQGYTLLSIAAVILGGGEFAGGIVAPVGTVVGAITISLVGSLLAFLSVPSDYQIGVQGMILIAVLAGRALGRRDIR